MALRPRLLPPSREEIGEFVFELCEEYGLPFTNNEPRWDDKSVYWLHPVGDLVEELERFIGWVDIPD